MAGRWGRREGFGAYGARGIPGWQALARELDRHVTGIASPVHSERGLAARLRYLTASAAGYAAMERAGISVTQRTLLAWLAEERTPNRRNRGRIDAAYWDLRRRNMVADFKRRLNSRGGTRIEIHPVDQRRVEAGRERDIPPRRLTIRSTYGVWDDMVDAWIAGDTQALDVIWDEIIADLGSDYDAYSYVESVGIGM